MPSTTYSIGTLAKHSGCKVPTIRWYEARGLLSKPERNAGNQRRYRDTHLKELRFIRHARALGFDLAAIEQLKMLSSCCLTDHLQADDIARRHLADIQQKIRQLRAMEAELEQMITQCNYDQEHQCHVLDVLADHSLCQAHHEFDDVDFTADKTG